MFAAGCGETEAPPPAAPVARPVKTFVVGETSGRVLRWPGVVQAAEHAELSFEVPGKLVALSVTEGQKVEAGQVIARLDDRDLRAQLLGAQARLRQARVEHDRTRELGAKGIVSAAEQDVTRRQLGEAQAEAALTRKAVEDAVLRAPFAGVVARVAVENHQAVQAKQPVVVLQGAGGLEVVTQVPERDMAQAGDAASLEALADRIQATARFDALPDETVPARLSEAATSPDPETGTYEVTWRIEAPEGVNILPGMTATIEVQPVKAAGAAAAAPLEVPAQAVWSTPDGEARVWKIDPKTLAVTAAPVQLGEVRGDRVQVVSGLAAGDEIATSGVHELSEGQVVRRFEDLYGSVERAR